MRDLVSLKTIPFTPEKATFLVNIGGRIQPQARAVNATYRRFEPLTEGAERRLAEIEARVMHDSSYIAALYYGKADNFIGIGHFFRTI